MRSRRILAAVVVALLVTVPALAQTPNFSGKWTLVPDPAAPSGGGMGGLGQGATIAQDPASMTVSRSTQMGEFTSTYKLDGSESRNTLSIQGNAIEQISTAKWAGEKLTVDTSMSFDGNAVQISMTMWLDASGNLVVESTRPDFQGGGGPITTKATYKKS
jgi:hypothetical protein